MASSLVENMRGDFTPGNFTDDYQKQLKQLIDAKIKEGDALDTAATFGEQPDTAEGDDNVVDLMEALRQSVERNRQSRAGRSTSSAESSGSASPKKPSTKKSTAKNSTAKSSTAKSSTAKKSAANKTAKNKASVSKAPAKKAS
jgi:DNA end-binding protein Ku